MRRRTARRRSVVRAATFSTLSRDPFRRRRSVFPKANSVLFSSGNHQNPHYATPAPPKKHFSIPRPAHFFGMGHFSPAPPLDDTPPAVKTP
jgi:hypothetical protein